MFKLSAVAIALAVGGAGAALADVAPMAAGDNGRVVCRRIVATGSVMATETLCRPEAAWKRGADGNTKAEREYWEERLPDAKTMGESIETGMAKWDKLPALKARNGHLPYSQLVESVEKILRRKECQLPGQSAKAFDIEVPYAVLMGADGKVQRVLVSQMNCPALESLVGFTVLARAERGDFTGTGNAQPRWYGDKINFSLQ